MAIFTQLAHRAATHPLATSFVKRAAYAQSGDAEPLQVPTWGVVLLFVTAVVGMVGMSLISYMLNELVTTLCMVESPVAAITVSSAETGEREEKEGLLETGPTITLVQQKPITSGIRSTINHLVAHAGRWARFRGLRIHFLYAFCFTTLTSVVSKIIPSFIPGQPIIVAALAGSLCANVHAAWTHKVVSMPTTKSFWQRIPARSHWNTLCWPAAIEAAMPYVAVYLICGFTMLIGLHRLDEQKVATYGGAQWTFLALRVVAVVLFTLACTLFLCLPAVVTLVRIEASILPDEEDTIVPFDRTFGGKVVSKLLGGTGTVSFLDAWRSFNWEARRRLLKLYVKVFFITVGVAFVFVHVFVFEIFAIMGPQVGRFLSQMKHEGYIS